MEALQARSELEETLKRLQQHKARIAVVRIISSEIHIIWNISLVELIKILCRAWLGLSWPMVRSLLNVLIFNWKYKGVGAVTKTTLDNATTTKVTSMVSSITSQVKSDQQVQSKWKETLDEVCSEGSGSNQWLEVFKDAIQQDRNTDSSRSVGWIVLDWHLMEIF